MIRSAVPARSRRGAWRALGAINVAPVLCLLLWLLCASVACAAGGQLLLAPLELDSGPHSAQPSVAVDPGRGFIVTWQQRDGENTRLQFVEVALDGRVGRRGTIADSTTSGAEGAPARWFVNWADFPSLVVLDNGDWVSHWLQKRGPGTYAYEIRIVRSTDRGHSWSQPVIPHDDQTETEHGFVSLLPAGRDRVRVVWLDGRETASANAGHAGDGHSHGSGAMTLRSATVDRRGTIREPAMLDATTCECCQTDAAIHRGRPLVVYRDARADNLRNIHWVAHSNEGWQADQVLHDDGWKIAGCPVNGPALAVQGDEAFAVWTTMQDQNLIVRMARKRGEKFALPIALESGAGVVGRVDAAAWIDGGWLALWLGAGDASAGSALRLAVVDKRMTVASEHVLVTLPPGRSTGVPRMAVSANRLLVAWVEAVGREPRIHAMFGRHESMGAAAALPPTASH